MHSSMVKALPTTFSAPLISPFPLAMEQSGAPPTPNRLAKAMTAEIIGMERPRPVRERVA